MPLIIVIGISLLVGFCLWFLNTRVTVVDATIKQIISIVVTIIWFVWLLKELGVWSYLLAIG